MLHGEYYEGFIVAHTSARNAYRKRAPQTRGVMPLHLRTYTYTMRYGSANLCRILCKLLGVGAQRNVDLTRFLRMNKQKDKTELFESLESIDLSTFRLGGKFT